jgi:hypothetical protein
MQQLEINMLTKKISEKYQKINCENQSNLENKNINKENELNYNKNSLINDMNIEDTSQ